MKNQTNYAKEFMYNQKLKMYLVYIGLLALAIGAYVFVGADGGQKILFWMMLVVTVITGVGSFLLPNDREGVLRGYKIAIAGYLLTICFLKGAIMLMKDADFYASFIDNMYLILMVTGPLSYSGLVAKKIVTLRGMGKTKKETIEYLKKHGNDGNM